jgi:hypothetical protein
MKDEQHEKAMTQFFQQMQQEGMNADKFTLVQVIMNAHAGLGGEVHS